MRLNVHTLLPSEIVHRAEQKKRLSLGGAWFSLFVLAYSLPLHSAKLAPALWLGLATLGLLLYPKICEFGILATANASQMFFIFVTLNLSWTLCLFADAPNEYAFIATVTGGFLFFCTRSFRLRMWQTNVQETQLPHMHNAVLNHVLKDKTHLRQGSTRIDSQHPSAYELGIYVVAERNSRPIVDWDGLGPWLTFFPEWDLVRSAHMRNMVDILNMVTSAINLETTRRDPFDSQDFHLSSHDVLKRLAR
jgi:hypothetical protein